MTQMARRVHRDDDEPGGEIVPATGIQKVQTNYTTAMQVQKPRELTAVEEQSLKEASLLGADGFYAWGSGKDRIEGPSKELAMALVRAYGNCAVDLGVVQETRDAWIFTATFVDLETGFTLARQFRQSKGWTVYGKFDEARKDDIRFQIGQSKAVRNVILNALPGWLVRRAMDRCRGGVRESIEQAIGKIGMEKFAAEAIRRLVALGATEANVLHAMGRKNVPSLTLEDFVILAGAKAAIESGQDMVEDLFPEPPPEKQPAGSKSDQLANKLGGDKGATPIGAAVDQVVQTATGRTAEEAAAEVAQAREKAKAVAPEPTTRKRWEPAKSPASPGYRRGQLVNSATGWLEAYPGDANGHDAESLVRKLEDTEPLPGPDDVGKDGVTVTSAADKYRAAIAKVNDSPDAWAAVAKLT